ncbi:MAG: PRC-barrel domain-containing protein [Steroidobacteraceae bacterium]
MDALRPNHDGIIGTPNDHGGPGPHVMAADTLTGERVVSESGERLGHISHIMLDLAKGQIAYAVLSVGGLAHVGEKLFAVPWSALALDVENKWFVLHASRAQLHQAAGFDRHHWPRAADPHWLEPPVSGYDGPVTLSRRPFI